MSNNAASLIFMRRTAFALLLGPAVLAGCNRDTPEALVASGKELVVNKDPRSAAIQFKAALQIQPEAAATRLLLGKALLDSADPVSALTELNKALELGQPKDVVVPLIAQGLLATGEAKKLIQLYDSAELGSKAATASLKTSLATAWGSLGNRAKADAALAAAFQASPDFPAARILQARSLGVARDLDGATALVDKALKQDASNPEAWQLKGELLVLRNDLPGAAGAFKQALALNPGFVPAHQGLIGSALLGNDMPEAKKQLGRMREALPKHPYTLLLDTQIAFIEGELPRAKEQVQALLRGAADNSTVLILAGAIEASKGSLMVAESHFAKALRINPELPLARRSLAQIYLRLDQPGRALEQIKPLVEGAEVDAQALALAGDATLRMGDPRGAEALYLRAAKAEPENRSVQTALALTHLNRGDGERAFAELAGIAGKSDDLIADMATISARVGRGQWAEALAALDAAAKKAPKNVQLADLRGRVHLARADYPAARQAFEAATALDPKHFPTTANLAAIDLLEKKPEQAVKRLQDAIKGDLRNFYASMALADLRGRLGANLEEQRQILVEAIKANPSEPSPRLMLIEVYLRNKRVNDALQAAQEAGTAIPNDKLVLDALGRAQTQSGDIQQAITSFKKLASLDPRSVLPHTRLADLYRATGDRKSAEQSWKRVLEIEPSNGLAQVKLIEALLTGKRVPEAVAFAREIQGRAGSGDAGFLFEGAIHRRAKAPDAAVAAYRSGLKREPLSSELAFQLYQMLLGQGRKDEASAVAASWQKANPKDGNFEYQLSNISMNAGDYAAAERRLALLVQRFPESVLALNNLAWSMTKQGKAGAVAFAERAVAAAPDKPAVIDTLAQALAAENQVARALETQKRAVSLAPNDAALRLNLARIAIQGGDKALAKTELEQLAARGSRISFQPEVTRLLKSL